MARALRLEVAGAFYHCLNRGVERRPLFGEEEDYHQFLEIAGRLEERFGVEVWSYVLMSNHFHLLVRTRKENLSRAMQWLGVAYASSFNARHKRSGHLFGGRFKSFLVEEEGYLSKLILYLHRNPLRAGLVRRLADYPWSSYRSLAYGRGCPSWLKREEVLRLYGGSPEAFRKAVQEYSKEEERLLEDLRFGVLLGGERAAQGLRERLKGKGHREKPQERLLARSQSLEARTEALAELLGLTREEVEALRQPVRRRSRPLRDVLIYLLWRRTDYTAAQIGDFFNVGYTTISNARVRGEKHVRLDRMLQRALRPLLEPSVK